MRTDVTAPAVGEIFKEIRGMADKPMTSRELTSAKDSMINSLPGAFETSSDAVGNFANMFIYDLRLDYYSHVRRAGERRDAEQALAMAKKYLVPDRIVIVPSAIGRRSSRSSES